RMGLRFGEDAHPAPAPKALSAKSTITVEAPVESPSAKQAHTIFTTQADAPSCADCGSIMVRNGSCYKCLNCGGTSGCS
ncbi:hypothetical protein KAI87_16985, partial [Myxococcota bacterium]|nr:hypothetical protein [Myxococcota bacterium]